MSLRIFISMLIDHCQVRKRRYVLANVTFRTISRCDQTCGKLELSLGVLYHRRRSCIRRNSLFFSLSEPEKCLREKGSEIPRSAPGKILRQPQPRVRSKESKILPRSLAVRQCRVHGSSMPVRACIILCIHIWWTSEKARRVLIIGSGWPNCLALDSSFLVLDNLSRILAKILNDWRC